MTYIIPATVRQDSGGNINVVVCAGQGVGVADACRTALSSARQGACGNEASPTGDSIGWESNGGPDCHLSLAVNWQWNDAAPNRLTIH